MEWQTKYGKYVHQRTFCSERTWFRLDLYICKDGTEGGVDRFFAASHDDMSPPHDGYDGKCSCCWLGFPHTSKAHELRITKE